MALQTVLNILLAASDVTDLVADRISPVIRAQNETLPAIVLTSISVVPQSHLKGPPTLDANRIQLDVFAGSYAEARGIADACRVALEAGDCVMDNEFDGFEPDVTEHRVTQDWLVWT